MEDKEKEVKKDKPMVGEKGDINKDIENMPNCEKKPE
jgi:hypothetical protein